MRGKGDRGESEREIYRVRRDRERHNMIRGEGEQNEKREGDTEKTGVGETE